MKQSSDPRPGGALSLSDFFEVTRKAAPMPVIGNIDPSIRDVIFSPLAFAAFLRL